MKRERKHILRRGILFICSILTGAFIALIICCVMKKTKFVIDTSNMIEVSKVMVGVWGTLLGFIITAESILVAFEKGTVTGEFKQTGHYMTVIFQYTQTSIKLLIYILAFVCIMVRNVFEIFEMYIFIFFTSMTFIDILISFIILLVMLKMANN